MSDSVLDVLASYADCGCLAERTGRNPARCSGHRPEVDAHAGRRTIEAAVCTCACHDSWVSALICRACGAEFDDAAAFNAHRAW